MTKPSEKASTKAPAEKQHVPGTVSIDQVKPPPTIHQRDVSALTTFDDVAADNNHDAPLLSFPAPPPPRRHNRGISVDLTRRHLMPHKEPEPLLPIPPPRARDIRPMAADGRASTAVKKTTWGAASKLDSKVVGLGTAARYSAGHHEKHDKDLSASLTSRLKRDSISNLMKTIDDEEKAVRDNALTDPFKIMIVGNIAAVKVFGVYLITLDTILSISLSIGLTCYWYFTNVSLNTRIQKRYSRIYIPMILVHFIATGTRMLSIIVFAKRHFPFSPHIID